MTNEFHGPYDDDAAFEKAKELFCARFKAEMLRIVGITTTDGTDVAKYADETAPTYFDDPDQRAEGPEACAEADISYWEE